MVVDSGHPGQGQEETKPIYHQEKCQAQGGVLEEEAKPCTCAVPPARPLRHLTSPTASSERRQVISVRRDGTMPSFSQLDGNVNHSHPPPGPTSSASTPNPLAGSHCPTGTVEHNADYGDLPPSDAPPPPTCVSCHGSTEWGWTRRLQNNTKHGYRCLALCLGEDPCITTTIFT